MNDYGTVRLLGPKAARKVEKQHDGLVQARERFMLELGAAAYGSAESSIANTMVEDCQDAILVIRAALMGVTVEWYKQSYCF